MKRCAAACARRTRAWLRLLSGVDVLCAVIIYIVYMVLDLHLDMLAAKLFGVQPRFRRRREVALTLLADPELRLRICHLEEILRGRQLPSRHQASRVFRGVYRMGVAVVLSNMLLAWP